jgi:Domain of unknown function (DUF4824)
MTLTWSRRRTLIAGLALIALTNAVALSGVAWNRSGEPESVLKLTERELWQPYRYRIDKESGGLELNLRWRVLTADRRVAHYVDRYGTPEWLDQAKLASLGFQVSRPPRAHGDRYYDRVLPREALIVLELDGPARETVLESARAWAKEAAARAAAAKDKKNEQDAQNAAENLQREETVSSRLFVVDAGHDAAALRAKYPDRVRYVIVRGSIRAQYQRDRGAAGLWTGHIEGLDNGQINVPLEFRRAFGTVPTSNEWESSPQVGPPFQATVAFGKRFEPWIVAVEAGK